MKVAVCPALKVAAGNRPRLNTNSEKATPMGASKDPFRLKDMTRLSMSTAHPRMSPARGV